MKKYLMFSIFLGLSLSLGACGSAERDYCEAIIDCEGGSDSDVDDCVAEAEDYIEEADDYGCKDEYNEMLNCAEEHSSCSVDDEYTVGDACEGDLVTLLNCYPDDYYDY